VDASQIADVEGTLTTAGVVLLLGLAALRLVSRDRFDALRGALRGSGAAMAGVVAVLASAASLWYSEGAHFPPCELCWYQRIAMYPLALLLPVAAVRRDETMRFHGVLLASAGLTVSAWHNVVETFPTQDLGSCDPTNPCTIRWVEGLGFWTIPRMAAVSFALVIAALLLPSPRSQEEP
jgi:disulfide bond formation protein DsbB